MKALFVESPGRVALRELERPTPREGEVLVKMKCCGVCGTDLEKAMGEAITSNVLGHEVVGEVAGLGQGVGGLKVGDRVFTHHHVACYSCDLCERGEYTLCSQFSKSNIVPCGFSEFYVVPQWNVERGGVIKLPNELSYEDGSFIEPLGCCIRALDKVRAENFSSALVYGAGPVGLLHLKLLKERGVRDVAVADVSELRLSYAKKSGADLIFDPRKTDRREEVLSSYNGGGPELVVVATGNVAALQEALSTLVKGGTLLLFGAPPRDATFNFEIASFFIRGISLVASYSASEKETNSAARMLAESTIRVSDLVTHKFSLERASDAFAAAREQKCMKALVMG
ncbi:MAG: alcohol dehydrogenase catalytic domain-containing protein [Thaumarchaeota archaeon]|nr:alcohol dehydrogenase catalytic domain-containing protein [Nitrososphaerota archaeon]